MVAVEVVAGELRNSLQQNQKLALELAGCEIEKY